MTRFWTHILGSDAVVSGAPEDVREVRAPVNHKSHPFIQCQGHALTLYDANPAYDDESTFVWAPSHMGREEVQMHVQEARNEPFSEWLDKRSEHVSEIALKACANLEVLLRLHPVEPGGLDRMLHGTLFHVMSPDGKTVRFACETVTFQKEECLKIVKPVVAEQHIGEAGKHTAYAEAYTPTLHVHKPTAKPAPSSRDTIQAKASAAPHIPSNKEYRMSNITYVQADMKKGKKFQQVAQMFELLIEARTTDQPVIPFEQMCDVAGAKYPQDVQAAVFALELSGVCDRYTYTEPGSTRSKDAYAIRDDAKLMGPES